MEDTLEKAGGEETMSDKLKVNMNEYLPLRDVVFNTLRQAIITGEFAPGERLMEIALANRLGVSRTPVREAIRKLELEGLVKIIPNKGAYVTGITPKDVQDIYMIRSMWEGMCARWATEHITPEQIEQLEEIVLLSEFHLNQQSNLEIMQPSQTAIWNSMTSSSMQQGIHD